jgi:hypothetical protein
MDLGKRLDAVPGAVACSNQLEVCETRWIVRLQRQLAQTSPKPAHLLG